MKKLVMTKSKLFNIFFMFFIFFGLFLSLLLAEAFIRTFLPQTTFYERVQKHSSILPAMFKNSSVLPYDLKPGLYHMFDGNNNIKALITINNLGYRGRSFTLEKARGKNRILFIGDSQVFGYGLGDEEAMPALLEKKLMERGIDGIEIINAGFRGYTSLSHYVYLTNFGVELKPDIILLGVLVDNDVTDLKLHRITSLDAQGRPIRVVDDLTVVDGFRIVHPFCWNFCNMPVLNRSHLFYLSVSRFFNIITKVPKSVSGKPYFVSIDDGINEWFRYVEFIKELCERHSIDLIVVVFGAKDFLYGNVDEIYQGMLGKLRQAKIKYIDLAYYLQLYPVEQVCFPRDGHLNAFGVQKCSEYISGYLIKERKVAFTADY